MHKGGLTSVLVLSGALFGGCAEGPYVYRPAQTATSVNGLPAARQPVPRDKPSGDIAIATSGVTEIRVSEQPTRAIFVRVIVSNRTDEAAWAFDTRKQSAIIAGQPTMAAYVNAYQGYEGATSIVRVPRAQSRTVDFYFPLPAGVEADDNLPPFELSWNIQTAREMVADRTPFNRVPIEPVYASSAPYSYGYYGPYGWYDPFWPPLYLGVHVGYGGYPGRYYGYPHASYYRGGGRVYFGGRGRLR